MSTLWSKPKFIDVPVYNTTILVFNSFEKADKWFSKNNPELQGDIDDIKPCNGCAGWFESPNAGTVYYMIVPRQLDWIVTLIHELLHLVHFILNHRGIPLCVENTEVEAYLLSQLQVSAFKLYGIPLGDAHENNSQ